MLFLSRASLGKSSGFQKFFCVFIWNHILIFLKLCLQVYYPWQCCIHVVFIAVLPQGQSPKVKHSFKFLFEITHPTKRFFSNVNHKVIVNGREKFMYFQIRTLSRVASDGKNILLRFWLKSHVGKTEFFQIIHTSILTMILQYSCSSRAAPSQ